MKQAHALSVRDKVRATYGPQGTNPKALYDENNLVLGILGAEEEQRKKEKEMKVLGAGLLTGAVAAPLALDAVGSAILEAPATLRAAGTALNQPIFGQAGLTPNTLLTAQGMYTGIKGLYNESVPQWQEVYKNPTGENIAQASLSTVGNVISISPSLSKFTSKPFTKWISEPTVATAEATAINNFEKFLAKKAASQVKSETKDLLKAGFEPEEPTQEYIYPVTPRRGLYADNPYYPILPESTGTAPIYYAQNLIAAPESTGVAAQPNWLNNYR